MNNKKLQIITDIGKLYVPVLLKEEIAMFQRLKGQTAIITGGAQGLGEALAQRLDQEGCNVVVADINFESAQKVAASLTNGAPFQVDVTNVEQVEQMVDFAVEKFGGLDLVVSNAAILIAKSVTEFTPDEWRKMMDVNLVGYFMVARAAARVMIPNGKGNIIQINSKSGKKGSYKNSAYAASKFGGIGLTQSLALEIYWIHHFGQIACLNNMLKIKVLPKKKFVKNI
jgi:sorbitol-6-phosphate 2-dehydrogenase